MAHVAPKLRELLALLKQLQTIKHPKGVVMVAADLSDPAYTIELEVLLNKQEARTC